MRMNNIDLGELIEIAEDIVKNGHIPEKENSRVFSNLMVIVILSLLNVRMLSWKLMIGLGQWTFALSICILMIVKLERNRRNIFSM